jgi:DsbC/DsbD-like thiol-disulfide interchange protein
MKHAAIKYVAIIIAVLAYFFAAAEVAGAQSTKNLVQAELVADTTAVQGKFTLGLHLHIADGWHVYWKNPGDAGGPTTFKISAPAGFVVSDVKYPVPKVLTLEGGLTEYVYEKELLLTATIMPPGDLVSGKSVTFTATAGWCVCNPERCVLGKKALTLDLPVAPPIEAANADLFAAWQPRMPMEASELVQSITVINLVDFSPGAPQFGIMVNWRGDPPARDFRWLPDANDVISVQPGTPVTSERQTRIPLTIKEADPASTTTADPVITGILAYTVDGQNRGVTIASHE